MLASATSAIAKILSPSKGKGENSIWPLQCGTRVGAHSMGVVQQWKTH
jgi:hypothetical protein